MCSSDLGLIEQHRCAGSETVVEERITKIQTQWEYLVEKSSEKSQHLKEAYQQQQFDVNVKDLDFWLGEVNQTVAWLAQLVWRQFAVREVSGSIPGRTTTQGLKIIEEEVLPLLKHLQMVRPLRLLR